MKAAHGSGFKVLVLCNSKQASLIAHHFMLVLSNQPLIPKKLLRENRKTYRYVLVVHDPYSTRIGPTKMYGES